ncbi:MAG: DNA recombination protein RmuC [Deltaproteobacteria bacterium]|nr:DNA recombination protein RmuC [Deltaproteobacteria bacterium]
MGSFAIFVVGLVVGLIIGTLVTMLFKGVTSREKEELASRMIEEAKRYHSEATSAILEQARMSFGSLSRNALLENSEEFLRLANSTLAKERSMGAGELEGKKALIDGQLELMRKELQNVATIASDLEKDRVEKFAQLSKQIQMTSDVTSQLAQTTGALKEALSSSQKRGQWGERMAEDIFRTVGLKEGINYTKQTTIEGTGKRPDFTFLLPGGVKMHMDVKFPLDNYLRFLETSSPAEKEKYRRDFLADVKMKIKDIARREYINPAEGTVDCALCFIPNEQVFSFIYETDAGITMEAMQSKVVICSPITVFAVLALIRQATENFNLSKTTDELLGLLGAFRKQWEEFAAKMDGLGNDINKLQNNYEALVTTRRRALERPLNRIESIREQKGVLAIPSITE